MSHSTEENKTDELYTKAGRMFAEFVSTVSRLRDPEHGCPWDLQQNFESLRKYMLEEAYEASEAMHNGSIPEIIEELGDVMLQVVLNAQIVRDLGGGNICDVVSSINDKMVRRHPHVFQRGTERKSVEDIKLTWETIKKDEQLQKGKSFDGESYFAKCVRIQPALSQAQKIGKLAKKIDFDWPSSGEVLSQVRLELDELEEAMLSGSKADVASEMGDVFFSLAQLSRHLDIDPEVAAQSGCLKFLNRFKRVEAILLEKGELPQNAGKEKLEQAWQQAKTDE